MWTRKELKTRAKINYKKNPWICILSSLVLVTLTGASFTYSYKGATNAAQSQGFESIADAINNENALAFLIAFVSMMAVAVIIGILLRIFIINPLKASASYFYVINNKEEKAEVKSIFKGTEKGTLLRLAMAVLMKKLICSLWGLLFVIPGIVKEYQYRFVENLIIENPDMKWNEAMKISKEMTNGQKASIFVLDLSFILWYVLAAIPVIGWFVLPYILQTDAELYLELKKNNA